MSRRRNLLLVLGTIVLLGVVAAILLLNDSRNIRTQTAPDGTLVRLLKITSGTQHRYVDGNLLQRTAARLLPDSLAKKLKITTLSLQTTNFAHALWFEIAGVSTNVPVPRRKLAYQCLLREEKNHLLTGWLRIARRNPMHDLVVWQMADIPPDSRNRFIQLHSGDFSISMVGGTNSPTFLAEFPLPPHSGGR